MAQPALERRLRGAINSALTGLIGSKRALALRCAVDEATVTRAFAPPAATTTTIEPSADVVVEAMAMLCELGRPDVLEEAVRARGAKVRVVIEDADADAAGSNAADLTALALGSGSAFADVLNTIRRALDDGRVDLRELREILMASRALTAVARRIERTAEAVAGCRK